MKKVSIQVMILSLLFINSTKAQCDDCQRLTTINYATGVDNNNNVLNPGAFDGNWQVTNAPANANLGTLPTVPLVINRHPSNNLANWGWGSATAGLLGTITGMAWWISPMPITGYTVNNPAPGNNPFTLTYTFCVCEDGEYIFDGLFNADDWGQLNVDGATVLATANVNTWATVFQYNQIVNLTAGIHTLNIDLRNTNGTAMGVICSGSITNAAGFDHLADRGCCAFTGAVNGIKYYDRDGDGAINPTADSAMLGWVFNLNGAGGNFTSTTNQHGAFNFTNIPPGSYSLSEVVPAGWNPILPSGGSVNITVTAGNVTTVNFLNDNSGSPTRGCCNTDSNLMINGSFESGNTGFSTGNYISQGGIAPGSVREGEYSVVNSPQAQMISDCWQLTDHTTCSEAGHFMVVNGRTHNPQVSTVYSQSNLTVTPGEEYRFCMYYQHLPQCSFDVFDASNLTVTISGATLYTEECGDDDDCGWQKISYTLIPTTPTINVQVLLDESGIGDGNDIAFDDFTLVEKEAMPANYCPYNITTNYTGGATYGISANATFTSLPAGFNVQWVVEEVDCSNPTQVIANTTMSDPAWNPYNTNFPGYCCNLSSATPGVFDVNKCYTITRTVTNCCHKACSLKIMVQVQPIPLMRNAGTTNNDVQEKAVMMSLDGGEHWKQVAVLGDGASSNTEDIEIFPNPGDGAVTIRSTTSLKNAHVNIYNVEGKIVTEYRIKGAKGDVNISSLPNGVYSFEIIEENGAVTHKKYVKQQ